MRILLNNRTHWNDRDISRLIRACGSIELPNWTWSGYRWAELHVDVRYTRPNGDSSGHASGYAYYNSNRMRIRIAKENPDMVDLALVICHEMGHLKGLKHADMRGDSSYNRVGGYRDRYAWAKDYPLEKTVADKKSRPAPDEKLANVLTLIAKWEAKKKRADNALKKYKKRQKYYENRLGQAAAKGPKK